MSDVVIVEAVRTPLGRRKGGLSGTHSVELLGSVQKELFERSGVDPATVGQVVMRLQHRWKHPKAPKRGSIPLRF